MTQLPVQNGDNGNSLRKDQGLFARVKQILVEWGLADFAKLVAFTTIAGFFIIGSYLYPITGLFTYNLDGKRYIAAALSAPIGLLYAFLQELARNAGLVILGIVKFIGLCVIISLLLKRKFIRDILKWLYNIGSKLSSKIWNPLKPLNYPFLDLAKFYSFIFILFIIYALSNFYGAFIYPRMPQLLGGGKPTDVILIFNEGQLDSFANILPIISANRTAVVELIMELTDGYLIRNKDTGVTLIIKNELIQAIVDPSKLLTATPNPSPTPNSSGTLATPILTVTP